MSESPKKDTFSFNDMLICKNCKEPFSLRSAYQRLHGLKFPNRDTSIIIAKCPICRMERNYTVSDLWNGDKDENQNELVKQLRYEIAQLKVEKDVIQKQAEKLLETNLELVKRLSQTSLTENKTPTNDALSESARPR